MTKATLTIAIKGATTHDNTVDVSFFYEVKITSAAGVPTIHEVGVDIWKKLGGKRYSVKTVDKVFDVTSPSRHSQLRYHPRNQR